MPDYLSLWTTYSQHRQEYQASHASHLERVRRLYIWAWSKRPDARLNPPTPQRILPFASKQLQDGDPQVLRGITIATCMAPPLARLTELVKGADRDLPMVDYHRIRLHYGLACLYEVRYQRQGALLLGE